VIILENNQEIRMNIKKNSVQTVATLIRAGIAFFIIALVTTGPAVMAHAADQTAVEGSRYGQQAIAPHSDTVVVVVPARKGLEYKLLMDKYAHMEYEWSTDGAALYFDFHGEPEGDTSGYFESFAITTSKRMKGSLTAPFAGSHGWYWKNETNAPVKVTLSVKGSYKLKISVLN